MSTSGNAGLRVAIVGATGVVGGRLLEVIDERALTIAELRLYSSEDHAGESIESGGVIRRVDILSGASDLADLDIVFLSLQRAEAEALLPEIAGPIVVDLSAASLMPSKAPLVAPGFTPREQVQVSSRFKLFHIPHPAALALATIVNALGEMPYCAVTLMLGASSIGHGAITHLVEESADLLNGKLELEEDERQAAFNLSVFPGALELEKVFLAQVAALTGKKPQFALQCVQVPVLHGTALCINLPNTADSAGWAGALRESPGILLVENDEPPTVVDSIEQEALLLNLSQGAAGISIWCVFDNARRAALTALWIAECLLQDAAEKLN
jgi:aspartate-semialdehyde dehydrogenase